MSVDIIIQTVFSEQRKTIKYIYIYIYIVVWPVYRMSECRDLLSLPYDEHKVNNMSCSFLVWTRTFLLFK